MTKKSKQISVFAIVSCLVYLLTAIECSPLLSDRIKFPVSLAGKTQELHIPNIEIILTIFFSIIAMRLYLHAWAIDESPVYAAIKKDSKNNKKYALFFEWLFRVSWVLMVTYLPSIFANEKVTVFNLQMRWELYFVLIFAFIFIWDLLMIDDIIKHSQFVNRNQEQKSSSIHDLKKVWKRYDVYLLILSIAVYINNTVTLNGDWENYKSPIFFVVLSCMLGICLTQLVKWSKEIFLSLKTIECKSSSS